jgi:hypothetical protein
MVQETVSKPIRVRHSSGCGASAVDACLLCQVKDICPLETLMSERVLANHNRCAQIVKGSVHRIGLNRFEPQGAAMR